MKKIAILLLVAVIGLHRHVLADTITLKDAEVLQGRVVSETENEIRFEVSNASRTIFSTRTIPRTEIQAVQRDTAEERKQQEMRDAYVEVCKYHLADSSYPATYYDQVIDRVFRVFLNKYPDSTNATELATQVTVWEAERDRVRAGETKYQGKWYSGDDAKKVAFQSRAAQLITEGDSKLRMLQYQAAIDKYRDALAVRPLPVEMVESINLRLSNACQKWRDSIGKAQELIVGSLQNCESKNRTLADQRSQLQKNIAANQREASLINSAKFERGLGHWVVRSSDGRTIIRDYGTVLPPPTRLGDSINGMNLSSIEAAIAANDREKGRLQTEQGSLSAQLKEVQALSGQQLAVVAQARAEAQKQGPPATPGSVSEGDRSATLVVSEQALREADALLARGDCRGAILKASPLIGDNQLEISLMRRAADIIDRAYDRWLRSLKEQECQQTADVESARRELSDARNAVNNAEHKLSTAQAAANSGERRLGQQAAVAIAQNEQNNAIARCRAVQDRVTQLTAALAPIHNQISQLSADRTAARQRAEEEARRRMQPTWWDKYWGWVAGGMGLAILWYLVARIDAWRS